MIELVIETFQAGGVVLGIIILVSIASWTLVVKKWIELNAAAHSLSVDSRKVKPSGVSRIIEPVALLFASSRIRQAREMDKVLEPILDATAVSLERSLNMVAVLAAILPLLGLLGTVLGMVGTFNVITLHGTGEPKLMAHGIRQALVTTEAGLLAALPILLVHQVLRARAARIEGELRIMAHRLAQQARNQVKISTGNISGSISSLS